MIESTLKYNKKSNILKKELAENYESEKEFEKALKIYFEMFENIRESKKQNVLEGYIENKIIALIRKLRNREDKKYYIEKYLRINNGNSTNNTKLIIMLAEILIENREYKEAEKYYQEIVKKEENITQDELYTYVYLLLCLNNYVEARNILEKMIKVKEKPYLLINIGQISIIERELENAKEYLTKASVYREVEDIAYYELAKIDILEENDLLAIEKLNRALSINSSILTVINENPLFEKVRSHTTVKVELVKREKKLLEARAIECINILEDIISLTITLDLNEKKNKLNSKIDNIIKEKQENKTLDEIAEEKFKQKEFIENNIKNAELD